MKIDRMIGILSVLLQQEKVTAPYLAEKFEVSRRTINRDIEALCMAGIPIVTEQGAGGGISVMDNYKMDRTLLTSDDMQAILAGLRSLDSVSGTKQYLQLMEKLSVGSSDMLTGDQHILIDLSAWDKSSLSPKLELIQAAINCEQLVSFTYYSVKGESHRCVEPYYLIFRWSSWYLWAYCLERNDFRLFKLNRITELKTGETFKVRSAPIPDLSAEKIFPDHYRVKAIILKEHKWRLVEMYGTECFSEQDDGSLLFEFGFNDKNGILGWILSFGDGAELLEPKELRDELAQFGEKLCDKYKNCN